MKSLRQTDDKAEVWVSAFSNFRPVTDIKIEVSDRDGSKILAAYIFSARWVDTELLLSDDELNTMNKYSDLIIGMAYDIEAA